MSSYATTPSSAEVAWYEAWLRESSETESEITLPNDCPWHSRAAIRELMRHAVSKQERVGNGPAAVAIPVIHFTATLTEYVYNDTWLRLASKFLRDGGQMRILVWNQDVPESLHRLRCLQNERNLEIRCSGTDALGDKLNHFMVVGDRAFRKEAPHKKFPIDAFSDVEPKISAQICFNDKRDANELVEFFETLWQECDPVDLSGDLNTVAP